MRGMVDSLNNLEQLYSQLDGKIRKVHADLGKKLYKLNLESREKFENLGQFQIDSDHRVGDLQVQVDQHKEQINLLENELKHKNITIDKLSDTVSQLERKQEETEERITSLADARGPNMENYRDLLVGLPNLEAKLKRHDCQFIEVNSDLREKYMAIDGLREEDNENIVQRVVPVKHKIRSMLPKWLEID